MRKKKAICHVSLDILPLHLHFELSETSILTSDEQRQNALFSIDVTPSGKAIDVSAEQPLNA